MKTSEALRLTKAKLWDGLGLRPLGFSSSIQAASRSLEYLEVYAKVRPVIVLLLYPHFELDMWLFVRGHDISDTAKLQATRHAWLDHLISHYEALND